MTMGQGDPMQMAMGRKKERGRYHAYETKQVIV